MSKSSLITSYKKSKPTRLLIVGSGHNGSTLLGLLLGAHSCIEGVGEWHNIHSPQETCSCGAQMEDEVFWKDLRDTLPREGIEIYRNKKDTLLGSHTFSFLKTGVSVDEANLRALYDRMYTYVSRKTGKMVIVSSASPEEAEILATDTTARTVIVHLVRDGRAVTWSYLKKYGRVFVAMLRWFGPNMKIELLKRRTQVPVLFVRYEDLVNDTESVLTRILATVECSFEPRMLKFRDYTHHRIGGNRMRFGTSNEIKEDTAWRHDMLWRYRALFGALFGWINLYYMRCHA